MDVFVTGATGLIGRATCTALLGKGHVVTALSRSKGAAARLPTGVRVVEGDPVTPGPWQDELARCDACVHLAAENIDGRWTAAKKGRIRDSRVHSTMNVAAVLARSGPAVLVSASAVGIYGSRGDEVLDESAPAGGDFLAQVTREWEDAAARAAPRARVVQLRSGLVLSRHGGALPRIVTPFRLFAGGPLGDGAFWQSWIHLADEVGLILLALEDERAAGPLNACAPEPLRNRDFAKVLGKVLRRPSLLPAPAFVLRLALGEISTAVLASQRAVPAKALSLGYRFRFPDLDAALRDLLT